MYPGERERERGEMRGIRLFKDYWNFLGLFILKGCDLRWLWVTGKGEWCGVALERTKTKDQAV